MNVKLKRVVNTQKTYVGSDKKEHYESRFYLVLENGKYVSIRPCFNNDYSVLTLIADTETK